MAARVNPGKSRNEQHAPQREKSKLRRCLVIFLVLLVTMATFFRLSVSRDSAMLLARDYYPSPLDQTRNAVNSTVFGGSHEIQPQLNRTQPYKGNFTSQSLRFGLPRKGKNYLLIYNNVPKCASRSLAFSIKELFKRRGLENVNSAQISDPQNYTSVRNAYETAEAPGYMGGHVPFVHLERDNVVRINMIRDPVDRYVSLYYFNIYGDVAGTRQRDGNKLKRETIDEYIAGGGTVEEGMFRYFLEDDERNRNLSRPDAVQACKANIDRYFILVGLTEEFETTIRLLERLLPQLLNGLGRAYNSKKKAMKRRHSTINKVEPSNETKAIIRDKLKYEYDLYYFVKKKFHRLVEEFRVQQN